ncbi:P-loop containing nucleoside triphosphate hydrolase protein [Mycena maculata]|uniref:P-loop containing nucleoside triphosphate hydrolase protein n=1 Tax=Mycena maculata TaxID=230809 RepID=A0AAD7IQA8_9AGAR|nr:P-loop containing nucleoside triphosphate hydrolase protein [Mycena maculata]
MPPRASTSKKAGKAAAKGSTQAAKPDPKKTPSQPRKRAKKSAKAVPSDDESEESDDDEKSLIDTTESFKQKYPDYARPPEGIAFLLHALIGLQHRPIWTSYDPEGGEPFVPSWLAQLYAVGLPPLWLPEPPPAWRERLGAHWDDLRDAFTDSDGTFTIKRLQRFEWTSSESLIMLAIQVAKHGKDWATAFDSIVSEASSPVNAFPDTFQVKNYLHLHDASARQVYAAPSFAPNRQRGEWVPKHTIDDQRRTFFVDTLGANSMDASGPSKGLRMWWDHTISRILEAAKMQKNRAQKSLQTRIAAVDKVLGEDFLFGSEVAAASFSVSLCRRVLKHLHGCLAGLAWDILDPKDVEELSKELPDVTPNTLKAWWGNLSDAAKRHERTACYVGWMAGMMKEQGARSEIKTDIHEEVGKEIELAEYAQQGYARGLALAANWPQLYAEQVARLHQQDVAVFEEELLTYTAKWQGREVRNKLTTSDLDVIRGKDPRTLINNYLASGDLGVERFTSLTLEQLDGVLGTIGLRPPVLRQHVAPDARAYKADASDVDIPGVTKPFALHPHQAEGIAALLAPVINMDPGRKSQWDDNTEGQVVGLLAMKQGWCHVPGTNLADGVGLGKTIEIIGVIAEYITLRNFVETCPSDQWPQILTEIPPPPEPHAETPDGAETPADGAVEKAAEGAEKPADGEVEKPADGAEKPVAHEGEKPTGGQAEEPVARPKPRFGVVTGFPDAPHIIVVPVSLLAQWETQIRRLFVHGAITLIVVPSAQSKWAEAMAQAEGKALHRVIILIAITTLARMAKFSIVSAPVRATVRRDRAPVDNVYRYSYATCYIDEAHFLRNGGAQWQAALTLASIAMLKIAGTATPIVEGLHDILNLARLIRPPGLTWTVDCAITSQLELLKKIKARGTAKRDAEAVIFMESTTTTAALTAKTAEQGGANDADTIEQQLESTRRSVVRRLQNVMLGSTVRRTGESKGRGGELITLALPPLTVVHVALNLTLEEEDGADSLVTAKDEMQVTARIEGGTKRIMDTFYNEARKYTSFPPGTRSSLITLETWKDSKQPISKLAHLGDLIVAILTRGPENVVPESLHRSQTAIVDEVTLGLDDVRKDDYMPRCLPALPEPTAEKPREKIIVFTLLTLYHRQMASWLTSLGLKVVVVNSQTSARTRNEVIQKFGESEAHVLLISNIGGTGLNLTFARTVILYDVNWSGVQAEQIYGRIHREGQLFTTFAFQLVARQTVDVLLAMISLKKSEIGAEYITPERSEAAYKALSLAAVNDAEELEEGEDDGEIGTEDEEIIEELTETLDRVKEEKKAERKAAKEAAKEAEAAEAPAKAKGRKKGKKVTSRETIEEAESEEETTVAKKGKGKASTEETTVAKKGKGKASTAPPPKKKRNRSPSTSGEDTPPPVRPKRLKKTTPGEGAGGGDNGEGDGMLTWPAPPNKGTSPGEGGAKAGEGAEREADNGGSGETPKTTPKPPANADVNKGSEGEQDGTDAPPPKRQKKLQKPARTEAPDNEAGPSTKPHGKSAGAVAKPPAKSRKRKADTPPEETPAQEARARRKRG